MDEFRLFDDPIAVDKDPVRLRAGRQSERLKPAVDLSPDDDPMSDDSI